jgi:hypothetical protein
VVDVARPDIAHDESALLLGVARVREWVKRSRPRLSPDDVLSAAGALGLILAPPRTVAAVSPIDTVAHDDALAVADFVDLYRGDQPGQRRGLIDPEDWNRTLGPGIDALAVECRNEGVHDVLIRAACRLPTWFRIGRAFGETAGFSVATMHHGEVWGSPAPIIEQRIDLAWAADPNGDEMAVFVSLIADDPTGDAVSFLNSEGFPGGIAKLRLRRAQLPIVAAEGHSLAVAIRNEIRELVRLHQLRRLHLFLACPAPLALLTGHLWDRMPPTQLYEDLGSPASYQRAFEVGT